MRQSGKNLIPLIFVLLAFFLCINNNGSGADTNLTSMAQAFKSGGQTVNSEDALGSVLRMLGAFIFVIAIFLVFTWFFKNKNGIFGLQHRKGALKIIEVKHIGSRQALIVVGYGKERILVGATANNISFISKLPDEKESEDVDESTPQEQNFFALLKNSLKSR